MRCVWHVLLKERENATLYGTTGICIDIYVETVEISNPNSGVCKQT